MLNNLLNRVMMMLADPRGRMVLRVALIALALLASWLIPQHYAWAEGVLIPGGQGV